MRELILMRHGLAVPSGSPGFETSDDDRPLTTKGERRLLAIARCFRKLRLKPDRVISSPLPRALRTAEILTDRLALAHLLEVSDELRPERCPRRIREWAVGRTEDRLLFVGHNPNLSELLSLCLVGATSPAIHELGKGGAASLRFDAAGRAEIRWILRPSLARRLAD